MLWCAVLSLLTLSSFLTMICGILVHILFLIIFHSFFLIGHLLSLTISMHLFHCHLLYSIWFSCLIFSFVIIIVFLLLQLYSLSPLIVDFLIVACNNHHLHYFHSIHAPCCYQRHSSKRQDENYCSHHVCTVYSTSQQEQEQDQDQK